MLKFKIVGVRGQYAELELVRNWQNLEPGKFYFVMLKGYTVEGEEFNDVDFCHIELMDTKISGSLVKNVKVVRFLKGRSFLGVEQKQHTCRLDQLPSCEFRGPLNIEVEAEEEIGGLINEISG